MTTAQLDLDELRAELQSRGLLPASALAVIVGGSVARGWQHARSDTDFYVVVAEGWTGDSNGVNAVALEPASVPTYSLSVAGRRWELRYWLDGQVDQLLTKVSWAKFEHGGELGDDVSQAEATFLGRITGALAVVGEDWLDRRRAELAASAYRSIFTARALSDMDSFVEDTLGLLEAGDQRSAVMAAQLALAYAANAVAISHGEYGAEAKWRARRIEAVASPILPFDRYWELATMRTYDPDRPETWVLSVLQLCRTVAVQVQI